MVAYFQRNYDMEKPLQFDHKGVKPEWLIAQRVIHHRKEPDGGTV